jgi:acyl-coenzyme A synthetase/AMP-(fatty) acid ligase
VTIVSPFTLYQHCEAALSRFAPDRIAFVADETVVTFGMLAAAIERLAAGLRAAGIRPGDVVGYALPNGPDVLPLFLAISRIGACAVPLFPMMPEATRLGIFTSLGCSLVVGDSGPAALHPPPDAQGSTQRPTVPFRIVDIATLESAASKASGATGEVATQDQRLLAAATSGTTGASKFVWMTQRNAAAVVSASMELARIGSWREQTDFSSMMAFPLSTSGALPVLGMLFAGVRLVFSRDLSPIRYCELAARWNTEALSAPPSYFEYILSLPSQVARPLPAVRRGFASSDRSWALQTMNTVEVSTRP